MRTVSMSPPKSSVELAGARVRPVLLLVACREGVTAALVRCLDDDSAQGAINVTSPNPVTNAELSRALGHALGRPAFLPVPGFALHALYGEMAELVVTEQRVVPARLERMSFDFRYPRIESALNDVLIDA